MPKPMANGEDRTLLLDARGLVHPAVLICILSALEVIPQGKALRVFTDLAPKHLLGAARQRGFQAFSQCEENGVWATNLEPI